MSQLQPSWFLIAKDWFCHMSYIYVNVYKFPNKHTVSVFKDWKKNLLHILLYTHLFYCTVIFIAKRKWITAEASLRKQ